MKPADLRAHAAACLAIADIRDALVDLERLLDKQSDTDPECPHSTLLQWKTREGAFVNVWMERGKAHALCYGPDYEKREQAAFKATDIAAVVAFVRRHTGEK